MLARLIVVSLICSLLSADKEMGSFVAKACITTDASDFDFRLRRQAVREGSKLCVVLQEDCKTAEVVILLDENATQTFYVSTDKDRCR